MGDGGAEEDLWRLTPSSCTTTRPRSTAPTSRRPGRPTCRSCSSAAGKTAMRRAPVWPPAHGGVRPERHRDARRLLNARAERSCVRVCARRRLAERYGRGVRVPRRNLRERRRALRGAGFRAGVGGRSRRDGGPGAPRGARVARNATSFGGDPRQIFVSGHSSGAHLAGNILVTDWRPFDPPPDVVKGGVCVSGMYDLRAPRLSARASYVNFDDRIEHEYSSQRHLDRLACPVIVASGDHDSPEFQRQSREFAAALDAVGRLDDTSSAKGSTTSS